MTVVISEHRRVRGRRRLMTRFNFGRLAVSAFLALTLALGAPAFAIDSGGGSDTATAPTKAAAPTLATARADIAAKSWAKAITDLKAFLKASPKSADGWNLLGFA